MCWCNVNVKGQWISMFDVFDLFGSDDSQIRHMGVDWEGVGQIRQINYLVAHCIVVADSARGRSNEYDFVFLHK